MRSGGLGMAERTGGRWAWRAGVAAVGLAGLTGLGVMAQPPAAKPPVAPAPAPTAPVVTDPRTVATINIPTGKIAITQEEFGKFLTDRGGADKLELFVNKRIIEMAAAEKGLTVTKQEMEAALKKDMDGITVKYDDFVNVVLPKYGKTLYEWMEDVIRPRLLLEKMSAGEVQVNDDDLKLQFERVYGEKRQIQMVLYPNDEAMAIKLHAQARQGKDEFDSVARNQPNPGLAASCGKVKPIGRQTVGTDATIQELAFKLKKDEVSQVVKTHQGYVFIKMLEVIPTAAGVTFETEKNKLKEAAYEEKMQSHIPQKFAALKQKAQPNVVYSPPKEWQAVTPTAPGIVPAGKGSGK